MKFFSCYYLDFDYICKELSDPRACLTSLMDPLTCTCSLRSWGSHSPINLMPWNSELMEHDFRVVASVKSHRHVVEFRTLSSLSAMLPIPSFAIIALLLLTFSKDFVVEEDCDIHIILDQESRFIFSFFRSVFN